MRVGAAALATAMGVAILAGAAPAQNGDVPAAGDRGSGAVAAAGEEESRAWKVASGSVLLDLDRLREEILVLKTLSVLQSRLLEWNQGLIESGVPPSSLERSLCEAEEVWVWCELLPATFGRVEEDG